MLTSTAPALLTTERRYSGSSRVDMFEDSAMMRVPQKSVLAAAMWSRLSHDSRANRRSAACAGREAERCFTIQRPRGFLTYR